MELTLKRIILVLATLLFASLSLSGALAYRYDGYYGGYGAWGYGPVVSPGYYYQPYTYGWSGWSYNRVQYRYHYPYGTYNYYGGPWGGFRYAPYPVVAYPHWGYYW
jgi:hypothetical protein